MTVTYSPHPPSLKKIVDHISQKLRERYSHNPYSIGLNPILCYRTYKEPIDTPDAY